MLFIFTCQIRILGSVVRVSRFIRERLYQFWSKWCAFALVAKARQHFLNLWKPNHLFPRAITDCLCRQEPEAKSFVQILCANESSFAKTVTIQLFKKPAASARWIKMRLHSSGILYTWTGVQIGTYWYVPVRTSTTRYKAVRESHGCTYWYVPVHTSTLKKTSCFLTHPERARRDKIKPVQLLFMGYNVTKSNFKTAQV